MSNFSDSAAQRKVESLIVQGVGAQLGLVFLAGGRIDVGGGAHVQVDARTENGDVLVEAYARHGELKGAQGKKVGQDVLKFALLRRTEGWVSSRMILAFATSEAKDSIRGWVAQAAQVFEIELIVVKLPSEVSQGILSAQKRQVMVNLSADEAEALADPN